MIKHIRILFKESKDASFSIKRGNILNIKQEKSSYILDVETNDNIGSSFTLLTIRYGNSGFSVKPIEVNNYPLYYKYEKVIIEDSSLEYDFSNIDKIVKSEKNNQISYDEALKETGGITPCPVILNIPLDIRSFEIGFRKDPIEEKQHMDLYDYVVPHFNYKLVSDKSLKLERIRYRYLLGRGIGIKHRIERHLEHNYLPILHATIKDCDLDYKLTCFCTNYEKEYDKINGVNYLLADSNSAGATFSKSQLKRLKNIHLDSDDPVLFMRIDIINNSSSPKIGFVRLPHINTYIMSDFENKNQHFDSSLGLGMIEDKVYLISLIEGKPCSNYELSPLINPKSKITLNLILAFRPIAKEKALQLDPLQFDTQKNKIVKYYNNLLKGKATIKTPLKQINNYWLADYIQIRQNIFGCRNDDVYSPSIGVYSPVASESNPVIESFACAGDFDYAKKCTNYFYKKQRKDGFIQNMVGYMIETCAAIIITNNVYNYTRDKSLIIKNKKGIIKACKYTLDWIDRNKKDVNQRGYGMIDGQVADPVDNKKIYMLNAYAYRGLKDAYHLLSVIGDDFKEEVLKAADEIRRNIIKAVDESLIYSPLVPLNDGTFIPFIAFCAEDDGASCLHIDDCSTVTHGTMVAKDGLLSAASLISFGVIDIDDKRAEIIERSINDICLINNTGFSQPYYNLLPYYNLRKGNINSFINEFYYGLTALSDKDTYYFWEHLFLATPHKTSEQSAFQIRLKELLVFDDLENNTQVLLKGIPDDWKNKKNNSIIVKNMRTRLGKISFSYENTFKNCYQISIDFEPFDSNTKMMVFLPIRKNELLVDNDSYVIIDANTKIIKWKTKTLGD